MSILNIVIFANMSKSSEVVAILKTNDSSSDIELGSRRKRKIKIRKIIEEYDEPTLPTNFQWSDYLLQKKEEVL
uniref:Uncharacterized protein n=1 Tax=Strongyloides venezuelensis TaxID=75913 RepID=A0A0K0G689_STRVS